ncbi:MAG: prolyl oligopeptidase family serine peptidase [Acidobacteriota bacterium]
MKRHPGLGVLGIISMASLIGAGVAGAQPAARVREPLPLDVATATRGLNGRSPIALSPDGQWVSYTVAGVETVPRATHQYSATGFPFAEGDSRMEATVSNVKTGETIRLGFARSSSWAAVWSPDGSRVAFYSDEGGEPGLWIWDKATRKSERFPGVMARPFFGFEVVRWSPDGGRILCKVVPKGMSLAEITALGMSLEEGKKFPKVAPGEPSVIVEKSEPVDKDKKKPAEAAPKPTGETDWNTADLAVLDLATKKVTRLAERQSIRFYEFSPDGKRVAYTVLKGWEPNTQQPSYDFDVVDAAGGAPRTLTSNVPLGYGFEFVWTPDGKNLAYIPAGKKLDGPIVVLPVSGAAPRTLKSEGVPSFNPGEGEVAPVADAKSENFYAVGGGALWRVDAATGKGQAVGKIPGWTIRSIVQPYGRAELLSPDGRTVWVAARQAPPTTGTTGPTTYWNDAGKAGFFAIDVTTGKARPLLEEDKSFRTYFNLDGSTKTGEIVFSATDQQHDHDLWILDTKTGKARQLTHINPGMEKYELGQAKLIEWRSLTGEPLKGALLLPPGYKAGQRLPLIVFVYGGDYGSRYLNRFGFWGLPALNCHIFATRGYAILSPDAPIREGMPMEDLMGTVMPGVNAAIDQGYADPDRLAVMGQSYGSYCTLALITQSTRFKAAIITAAVLHPDLFADYLGAIGYYEQGQGNMKGSIWEQRERYMRNSPIFLFDRIQTPLLIGQGSTDGRLIASDAIFAALQRLGKPVEYRVYQGEGHVITQTPNVLDFWRRRLDFLSENLNLAVDGKGGVVFEGAAAKPRVAPAPPPAATTAGTPAR